MFFLREHNIDINSEMNGISVFVLFLQIIILALYQFFLKNITLFINEVNK